MTDQLKKILSRLGIVAGASAAAAATSMIATHYLVNAAVDRKNPKGMEKATEIFAGKSIDPLFLALRERTGAELAARPTEEISIQGYDGTELVGHLLRAEKPRRLLIAMHGWRSQWNLDFGMYADFWLREGCSVLFAEQRGQNKSGGDYMGFGLIERYDCKYWAEWAEQTFGAELPVVLWGISMGAASVLMASGLALPPNVRGVVGDCGFTSPEEIWRHVAENNLHLPYDLTENWVESVFEWKTDMRPDEYATTDALHHNRIPVLLIHGADDHFVPVSMTYENYLACAPGARELLIVPGADHGMSYYTEREKYESTVHQFFEKYDI